MGTYARCAICGNIGWTRTHKCLPEWEWREERDHSADEWSDRRVRANDPEDAAILAAEIHDEEDYPLVRRGDAVIQVRRIGTMETSRWNVSAESVPEYHANPADEETT